MIFEDYDEDYEHTVKKTVKKMIVVLKLGGIIYNDKDKQCVLFQHNDSKQRLGYEIISIFTPQFSGGAFSTPMTQEGVKIIIDEQDKKEGYIFSWDVDMIFELS